MQSNNKNLIPVGVDDGFFNTKIYLGQGKQFIMPSRARLGSGTVIKLAGSGNAHVTEYRTNDKTYTVGASESDIITNDDYPMSDLNRIIVHHALREAGLAGKDVAISTGLPLLKYFIKTQHIINDARIHKKEANFNQQVFVKKQNEHTANIKLHKVGPEAAVAFYDYAVEEIEGKPGEFRENDEKLSQTIAFVDIGGKTTDIVVIENGDVLIDSLETAECGVHNIYSELRDHARERLSVSIIPDHLLDMMYSKGKLKVAGHFEDVSGVVSQSKDRVASAILTAVNNKIGSRASLLDGIAFIGGGAEALGGMLKSKYQNTIQVPDPVMANARGLYKRIALSL